MTTLLRKPKCAWDSSFRHKRPSRKEQQNSRGGVPPSARFVLASYMRIFPSGYGLVLVRPGVSSTVGILVQRSGGETNKQVFVFFQEKATREGVVRGARNGRLTIQGL